MEKGWKTFSCCCWFSQWGRKMGRRRKFAQLGLVKGSLKLWEIYPSSNGKQKARRVKWLRWYRSRDECFCPEKLENLKLKTFQHFPRGFAREDGKQLNRAAATQGRDSNFLRRLRCRAQPGWENEMSTNNKTKMTRCQEMDKKAKRKINGKCSIFFVSFSSLSVHCDAELECFVNCIIHPTFSGTTAATWAH